VDTRTRRLKESATEAANQQLIPQKESWKARCWINDWPSHNHMRLPGLIALSWSVETSPRSCAAPRQMAYDG